MERDETPAEHDEVFLEKVADTLAGLPGVLAVALGGSRARGTNRPDSDWDFAIYYRGSFDPQHLRDVGWSGEVSPLGAWGGGVFNGGAWLEVDGRHIDVHYRDLDDVEHQLAEARAGRFHVELLMFHQAGIPSYLVVAELGINQPLRGELPTPEYPEALRAAAPQRWVEAARLTLGYARATHAQRGHLAETAGAIGQATCQLAHAVLARRGEWVTNEKRLVERAGLREVDDLLAGLTSDPGLLTKTVDRVLERLDAIESAG